MTTDFVFESETISEGGIIMKNYPEREDHHYKTMRIRFTDLHSCDWPYVDPDVMTSWSNSNGLICGANQVIHTVLKAFHGAPRWKLKELEIFEECLSSIGMIVVGKYPIKK